jgi:peptidyl-prolyl cis-trans isomerase B (cyclophilin B)
MLTAVLISMAGLGFSAEQKEDIQMKQSTHPVVVIKTTLGDITVELDGEKAPISTKNFLEYVNEGHYSNTIFHRVIDGFMIQGGGFTPDMKQKSTHAPIAIESDNGLTNKRGTIAMARTGNPNSATAQFFINVVDNKFLDYTSKTPTGYGYAVFGKVTNGMDVVDNIRKVKTGSKMPFENVPVEPVEILKVEVVK